MISKSANRVTVTIPSIGIALAVMRSPASAANRPIPPAPNAKAYTAEQDRWIPGEYEVRDANRSSHCPPPRHVTGRLHTPRVNICVRQSISDSVTRASPPSRDSTTRRPTCSSRRAKAIPTHRCRPWPNPRCGFGFRCGQNSSAVREHVAIAIGDIDYGDDDFALRDQTVVQLHVCGSDVRTPAVPPTVPPNHTQRSSSSTADGICSGFRRSASTSPGC